MLSLPAPPQLVVANAMTARPNDVDGLLAELDDLLVDDSAKPPPAPANPLSRVAAATPPGRAPPPLRHTPTDDLDALLADLGGESPPPPKPSPLSAAAAAPAAPARASTNYAAGGADSGYRCSKCDFRVLSFADRAWTAEADYMFFRNFVPDCAKLATRLREHEGSTAYACQCNWISADTWAGKLPAQWFGG